MYTRAHPYSRGGYGYEAPAEGAAATEGAASSSAIAGLFEDPALEALQSRSLLLTGVTPEISEDDVKAACEPCAEVRQCIINPDKQTATIDFFDLRHAERARQHLKETPILGVRVGVQYTVPKPRSDDKKDLNMGTLYVRPQGADRSFVDPNSVEAYKMLFGQYGELKKVSSNRKREAEKFIEYFDCRGSQKAQELLNGYNFNGVILEVQYAQQPSRTLNRDSRISELVRGPYRRTQPVMDGYGPQRIHQQPPVAPQWGYAPYAPTYWPGYTAWDYAHAYGQYGAANTDVYAQYGAHQTPSNLAAAAASYAAAMSAYTSQQRTE